MGRLTCGSVRSFRKSVNITVGDRALEDLNVRAATQRDRAVAAESRDWLLVKSVMQPGERQRARVAVRFPHEGNATRGDVSFIENQIDHREDGIKARRQLTRGRDGVSNVGSSERPYADPFATGEVSLRDPRSRAVATPRRAPKPGLRVP